MSVHRYLTADSEDKSEMWGKGKRMKQMFQCQNQTLEAAVSWISRKPPVCLFFSSVFDSRLYPASHLEVSLSSHDLVQNNLV